jgi:hypothetical protein
MIRNDFYDYIFPLIDPTMKELGYEYKKAKGGWVKKTADLRYELLIGYWKIGNQFNTHLSFSVRHHKVQDIVNHYFAMNPAEFKNTNTINLFLTKLMNFGEHSYKFYSNEEMKVIIDKQYLPFIKNKIAELTTRYANLNNILELLINPKTEYYGCTKYLYHDKMIAIVIAKLINRSDYEKIVLQMRNEFETLKIKWPYCNEIRWYETYFDKMIKDLSTSPS